MTFTNDIQFDGSATLTCTVSNSVSGLLPPVLTAGGTMKLTGTPIHHAPLLGAGPVTLPNLFENVSASQDGGTSVSTLLTDAGSTFDTRAGGSPGIAVTGLTDPVNPDAQGWQYSSDGGTSWQSIGAIPANEGFLLSGGDLVRFLPDTGFVTNAPLPNTPVTLTFVAWDQTDLKTPHTTVAIAATGGGTAYSAGVATATESVLLVNQPPTFTLPASYSTTENDYGIQNAAVIHVAGFAGSISPGQNPQQNGQTVAFSVTTNDPALFTATGQPAISPTGILTFQLAADVYADPSSFANPATFPSLNAPPTPTATPAAATPTRTRRQRTAITPRRPSRCRSRCFGSTTSRRSPRRVPPT